MKMTLVLASALTFLALTQAASASDRYSYRRNHHSHGSWNGSPSCAASYDAYGSYGSVPYDRSRYGNSYGQGYGYGSSSYVESYENEYRDDRAPDGYSSGAYGAYGSYGSPQYGDGYGNGYGSPSYDDPYDSGRNNTRHVGGSYGSYGGPVHEDHVKRSLSIFPYPHIDKRVVHHQH